MPGTTASKKKDEVLRLHKAQPKMGAKEIAETLGISLNTVYKHLPKSKRAARSRRATPVAAPAPASRVSDAEAAIIAGLEAAITLTEGDLNRLRSAHTALVG